MDELEQFSVLFKGFLLVVMTLGNIMERLSSPGLGCEVNCIKATVCEILISFMRLGLVGKCFTGVILLKKSFNKDSGSLYIFNHASFKLSGIHVSVIESDIFTDGKWSCYFNF